MKALTNQQGKHVVTQKVAYMVAPASELREESIGRSVLLMMRRYGELRVFSLCSGTMILHDEIRKRAGDAGYVPRVWAETRLSLPHFLVVSLCSVFTLLDCFVRHARPLARWFESMLALPRAARMAPGPRRWTITPLHSQGASTSSTWASSVSFLRHLLGKLSNVPILSISVGLR